MSVSAPELSVVLATDTAANVKRVLRHLRAQSARERIELVLVTRSRDELALEHDDAEGLWGVQVVEVGSLASLYRPRADGIRAARAPVVVLGETHSFPHPHWGEALIDAHHRGPQAAVGPAIVNANPDSLISWSNVFLDYGPWVDAREGGPTDHLPGHNSSFKRDLLVAYGDRLEEMLRAEILLFADLRAKGHSLYLEPEARTFHLNVSRRREWLVERFTAGRMFAAVRAERWSWATRGAYCAGSPLIPLVRLRRTLRYLRRSGRASELLPRILPILSLGLVVSAVGELWGYAFGLGGSARFYHYCELHRLEFVVRPERWKD